MEKNFFYNHNDLPIEIGEKIASIMKDRNITQTELVKLCKEKGYNISQGTISNCISAEKSHNMTIGNLQKICHALEIDILCLLQSDQKELISFNNRKRELLLRDPSDQAFECVLNDYFTYFFGTTGRDSDILQGHLSFLKSPQKCLAKLTLETGEHKEKNGKTLPVVKIYEGDLVISTSLNSAYCTLTSEKLGEICFFAFNIWQFNNNPLLCIMANAVTISAGKRKRPTSHRMVISRESLTKETLSCIKGQLLMNYQDVLISSKKLKEFLKKENVPDWFRQSIANIKHEETYIALPEAQLANNKLNPQEYSKWISILRSYSAALKYNKISEKTDDILFSLISSQKKNDF